MLGSKKGENCGGVLLRMEIEGHKVGIKAGKEDVQHRMRMMKEMRMVFGWRRIWGSGLC